MRTSTYMEDVASDRRRRNLFLNNRRLKGMCSILYYDGKDILKEMIEGYLNRTNMRGPDAMKVVETANGYIGFARLAIMLKKEGYEVASYTGYTFEQLLQGTKAQKMLLKTIDVLIDGPFVKAEKSLELSFRGSRNQRILDVPASLAAGKAVLNTSYRWTGEY